MTRIEEARRRAAGAKRIAVGAAGAGFHEYATVPARVSSSSKLHSAQGRRERFTGAAAAGTVQDHGAQQRDERAGDVRWMRRR